MNYLIIIGGKTSHYMFIDYKKSKTKYKVKKVTDPKFIHHYMLE